MRHSGHGPRRGCWGALLGLSLGLLLTVCASWTNPAKPSAAFADDAAACQDEVTQAALTSGQAARVRALGGCLGCPGREVTTRGRTGAALLSQEHTHVWNING